jgi:hypothetical protein
VYPESQLCCFAIYPFCLDLKNLRLERRTMNQNSFTKNFIVDFI